MVKKYKCTVGIRLYITLFATNATTEKKN